MKKLLPAVIFVLVFNAVWEFGAVYLFDRDLQVATRTIIDVTWALGTVMLILAWDRWTEAETIRS